MLTPTGRSELHKRLKERWVHRKTAAHELLTKYGSNLPHCAILKVGSLEISMFVEDLIRNTGERFLKEMTASPAADGIVTISIPEACMPAARLAFDLMEFNVQHDVGIEGLLDLMETLHYCNALDIWDAITATLGQVNTNAFVGIIQGWIRRMQAKPLSEMCFPDGQAQGYVISSVTKSLLSPDQPEQVRIIPGHP